MSRTAAYSPRQKLFLVALILLLLLSGCSVFSSTPTVAAIGDCTPLSSPKPAAQARGHLATFPVPLIDNGEPEDMTAGPDGNIWFTEQNTSGWIGRVTPTGSITEFPLPASMGQPGEITAGPDDSLWFTSPLLQQGSSATTPGWIGRISPNGALRTFHLAIFNPFGIASGPDGNLWFTFPNGIGRMTPAGKVTLYVVPFVHGRPSGTPGEIITGPDGNLWFTMNNPGNHIGRITPQGHITEFALPEADISTASGVVNSVLNAITAGPDGNLWFTEAQPDRIGRITPQGQITEFAPSSTTDIFISGITTGSDGNIWFRTAGADDTNWISSITPKGKITALTLQGDNSAFTALTHGPDGQLWLPVSTGIASFQPKTLKQATFLLPFTSSDDDITVLAGLATGPDGNLWFTTNNEIGRITPSGSIAEFLPPNPTGENPSNLLYPRQIITGPDHNLWFDASDSGGSGLIGRVTPCGAITEFALPPLDAQDQGGSGTVVNGITSGPDHNLWFAGDSGLQGLIGRMTPTGKVTMFALPAKDGLPNAIVTGADGNLWFLDDVGISKITPDGKITDFPFANTTTGYGPYILTPGPDGNIWFADYAEFVRITPTGKITTFPFSKSPVDYESITGMTAGPDGNIWFTDAGEIDSLDNMIPTGGASVGCLNLDGTITRFPLPAAITDPGTIVPGPDHNFWFDAGNGVGRIASGK